MLNCCFEPIREAVSLQVCSAKISLDFSDEQLSVVVFEACLAVFTSFKKSLDLFQGSRLNLYLSLKKFCHDSKDNLELSNRSQVASDKYLELLQDIRICV